MNRAFNYLHRIKINKFINTTISEQGRKKYIINKKVNHNKHIIRKFSSYQSSSPPPNPNDPFWTICLFASSLGLYTIISKNFNDFKNTKNT
jgi:hypothetical protein